MLADKRPIVVDSANCAGCLLCALRCSFKEGGYNPLLAEIKIERAGKSKFERKISFTDKCDNCELCIHICPCGVLVSSRKARGGAE